MKFQPPLEVTKESQLVGPATGVAPESITDVVVAAEPLVTASRLPAAVIVSCLSVAAGSPVSFLAFGLDSHCY